MEAILLTIWIFAIVFLAYRLVVSERSNGAKGLGILALRSTIRNRKKFQPFGANDRHA